MNKRIVFLLALACLAGFAYAQGAPATPGDLMRLADASPATDWSRGIWESLLGDFAKSPFKTLGAPTTTLGSIFLVFNTWMFIVGTVWLSYGVLSGIVGTAQDGQALGARINTAWYPIRVTIGMSGMTPVLGGFTLWQGLLMFTATIGIGVANSMYLATVNSNNLTQLVGTGALTGAPALRASEVAQAVEAMLRANVCVHLLRQENARAQKEFGISLSSAWGIGMRVDLTPNGSRLLYGTPQNPESCGSVGVMLERTRERSSATAFRVDSVDYRHIRNAVSTEAAERLLTANGMIEPIAEAFANKFGTFDDAREPSDEPQDFDLLSASAQAKLDDVVLSYIDGLQSIISKSIAKTGSSISKHAQARMEETGWIGAGAWHSTFADANAALADAVSGIRLTARIPEGQLVTTTAGQRIDRLNALIDRARRRTQEITGESIDAPFKTVLRDVCADGGGTAKEDMLNAWLGTQTGNCSLGQALVARVINGTFNGSGGGSAASGSLFEGTGASSVGLINPVIAFKNLGDYVMVIGSTLVTSNFALESAAASTGKFVGGVAQAAGMITGNAAVASAGEGVKKASALAESVAANAIPLGWTLVLLGGFFACYLPMLPFIVWFGGILTYTASFLEGLIAMPLHSMAHLNTDGEGMGPATGKGYLFFLNTLCRPPIMVLGFFIATALSISLATLLGHLYLPAMAGVQGNSITGLASIIGLLAIYAGLNVVLLQGCFELVQTIPDQVISYMGTGDLSGRLGKGTESKLNALFMQSSRGGMAGLQGSAAAGAELRKQRDKDKKGAH